MSRRQPPREPRPTAGHYFDTDPTVPSQMRRVRIDLGDVAFDLDTDRGVFSHGRLDAGTELLLRKGPLPQAVPGDHLLDLGCGAGAIAMVLARRAPEACVWAVDVNERARSLCALNAERIGCRNIDVCTPDGVPDTIRFAEIWSNPPIRIGKAALHELLSTWLARLQPGGRAVLVVQRHLGADSLALWLTDQGYDVQRLASSQGYRLLELQPRGIDQHPTP